MKKRGKSKVAMNHEEILKKISKKRKTYSFSLDAKLVESVKKYIPKRSISNLIEELLREFCDNIECDKNKKLPK